MWPKTWKSGLGWKTKLFSAAKSGKVSKKCWLFFVSFLWFKILIFFSTQFRDQHHFISSAKVIIFVMLFQYKFSCIKKLWQFEMKTKQIHYFELTEYKKLFKHHFFHWNQLFRDVHLLNQKNYKNSFFFFFY